MLSEKRLSAVLIAISTTICKLAVQNQRSAEFTWQNITPENSNIWTNTNVLCVKALIVLQTLDAKNT